MANAPTPEPRPKDATRAIRDELAAEADRLASHLDDIRSEANDLRQDRVGHDSTDDGTAQTETDQAGQIAASLQDRLEQTNAAIMRIDNGTYGTCERCSQPISPARLEVRPTANTCA